MKVLHVITGINVGGAEAMLARLMESHAAAPDIRHEIVSLMAPGAIGPRIAATGTPIHSLDMRGSVPSPRAALRLASLVRRIRPDLIMGWMHHGHIASTWAAAVAHSRPAMIWNVRHSLGGLQHEKPLTRVMLRLGAWMSGRPRAIIYNSHVARDQYRALGYRARNDGVIPNGFDPDAYARRDQARKTIGASFGIADDRFVIGMAARNHPMKDVPSLIAAFAQLRSRKANAHLLLVGEGMDRPSDQAGALLRSLPEGSFTLAGHRGDVASWLAGLDILALPSAWGEGFPNIVGEAMACGVPCVATDVGDAAWVIDATGRIVQPRDPRALADALAEIAGLDDHERQALGQAAAARIRQHFTMPGIADRYAALFRDTYLQARVQPAPLHRVAMGELR